MFIRPHEINEVTISAPEMFAGYMVLDIGSQRTMLRFGME